MDGIPKFVSGRQPDARLLRRQHDAAALSAERQPAAQGRRSGLCRPEPKPTTLPPQTEPTIGDLLSAKGVSWAWYGGAWQEALDHGNTTPIAEFPVPSPAVQLLRELRTGHGGAREHLRDGGLGGVEFIKAIDAGQAAAGHLLQAPGQSQRAFRLCRHHRRATAHRRRRSPSREEPAMGAMLVVVTYDENGGIWDHVAPPKADRWGPGTRIPAIIVSPFAKKGFVDHTPLRHDSILRFIIGRFDLPCWTASWRATRLWRRTAAAARRPERFPRSAVALN